MEPRPTAPSRCSTAWSPPPPMVAFKDVENPRSSSAPVRAVREWSARTCSGERQDLRAAGQALAAVAKPQGQGPLWSPTANTIVSSDERIARA